MSDVTAPSADPFAPTTLDEETELAALANALRLADGFRLLFARCNQPSQRTRLMAKLESQFTAGTIAEVHFTEPVPHLLDALRERLPVSPPRAVFVSGLEYCLPVAADAENTSFIANLNSARNSFPDAIFCPLVLWLPEYALTAIVRGAPDFFSIRSGVYFFAASLEETTPLVQAAISGDNWHLESLPLQEKQHRVADIEKLLQDYQSLEPARRDYKAEVHLLSRLGHLHWTMGHWRAAEQAYQQCLEMNRSLSDRQGEGAALGNLGNVYGSQGRLIKAEQAYRDCLRISYVLEDRRSEGASLGNLGNVYRNQGRLAEAEQAYQQSLRIYRDLGDRHGEGGILGNLAVVYQEKGELDEAERAHRQELQICRDLSDSYGEAVTLGNLGILYGRQQRVAEAESVWHQSLKIFSELGEGRGIGRILANLALVKAAEGKIADAIKLGQSAIETYVATEDAAALEKVQRWVEDWADLTPNAFYFARPTSDS